MQDAPDPEAGSAADRALRRLLDQECARARAAGPDQAALWEALGRATVGGKRFRPALVSAAHDALGGSCPDTALTVGAAVELLHTAFVVHDDVIDGDHVRRGRLNVSGTYRNAALGRGAAPADADALGYAAGILAGDLALAAAIRAVATCGAAGEVLTQLLDLFSGALHTTAAGELADVRFALGSEEVSPAESLTMAEQKTSAYSFAMPLQAGAVLAGADARTVARLGEAGRVFGVGFQLVDDLLGVFGDPARTGKSVTSDLRTRKQTPLLTHATTTAEWAALRGLVGRDLTADELDEARRLLTASGSRRFVEELAESHFAEARAIVAELGIPVDVLAAVPVTAPGLLDSRMVAA